MNYEKNTSKVTGAIAAIWALIDLLFMILALVKTITYVSEVNGMLILSVIVVTACLGDVLYLYCKFSGIPYIN
jgi:hypothetical protein